MRQQSADVSLNSKSNCFRFQIPVSESRWKRVLDEQTKLSNLVYSRAVFDQVVRATVETLPP